MPKPSTDPPLSEVDKLERTLARLMAAEKRKMKNEDIVRVEKNGDLSYERVRTTREPPVGNALREVPPASDDATPNSLPETPSALKNGQIISTQSPNPTADSPPDVTPKVPVQMAVETTRNPALDIDQPAPTPTISEHEAGTPVQNPITDSLSLAASPPKNQDTADPLEELLSRALSRPRRGRPAIFDDKAKGQIIALLSLGMSLRQAASILGVSHNTIRNVLKADPALAEEISAARFQAQLQPLACVIREARRSWKAATWLLKYLDSKIASHEETPDERRERQQRESDEFFARSTPGIKKRKLMG